MPAQYYDPYEFFQTGMSTNNRLNISNGTDKGSYYFSVSNLNQEGIIPNNKYGRTTMRLNSTTKLEKWLSIGRYSPYSQIESLENFRAY